MLLDRGYSFARGASLEKDVLLKIKTESKSMYAYQCRMIPLNVGSSKMTWLAPDRTHIYFMTDRQGRYLPR